MKPYESPLYFGFKSSPYFHIFSHSGWNGLESMKQAEHHFSTHLLNIVTKTSPYETHPKTSPWYQAPRLSRGAPWPRTLHRRFGADPLGQNCRAGECRGDLGGEGDMSTIQNHSKALIDDYTDLYEIYINRTCRNIIYNIIENMWLVDDKGLCCSSYSRISQSIEGIPSYDWIMPVMVSPAKIWQFHLRGSIHLQIHHSFYGFSGRNWDLNRKKRTFFGSKSSDGDQYLASNFG